MKYLLTIFLSLFFTNLISEDIKEYIITGSDVTKTMSFDLGNSSKFSSFTVNGSWTDNYGNYGFNKCMGIINKILMMLNFILCVKEKIKMVTKFGQ